MIYSRVFQAFLLPNDFGKQAVKRQKCDLYLQLYVEMGKVLREADSGLNPTLSNSGCTKQLQERNTSRNGKVFPGTLLGAAPPQRHPSAPERAGVGETPQLCGTEGNVQAIAWPPAARPGQSEPGKREPAPLCDAETSSST